MSLAPTNTESGNANETTTLRLGEALQAAMAQHQQGNLAVAAEIYGKILEAVPDHPDATHLLGVIALQRGDVSTAERMISKACRANPAATNYHFNLGQTLIHSGRQLEGAEMLWSSGAFEEAEAVCRKFLEANPDSSDGKALLAQILGDLGRVREAETLVYDALDLSPAPFTEAEADAAASRIPAMPPRNSQFTYIVEVVGTCNLRCPSCPVGNLGDAGRGRGFMDVGLFREIVAKIRRETPNRATALWLFNWGEPLLHPELPKLIEIGKEAGLAVCLSSNLNYRKDFRDVIKAEPYDMIISCSGFTQEVYRQTHARGDIGVVKENMRKLRAYIDEFRSKTDVRVVYHLYRHNLADAGDMRQFAESLGFGFSPTLAFLQPIEKVVDAMEYRLAEGDRGVVDLMLLHPVLSKLRRRDARGELGDCTLRTGMMTINHDGTVALCCGVYRPENMLGANFLDLSHEELQGRKYGHAFCKTCYRHGLHDPASGTGAYAGKENLLTMRLNALSARQQRAAAAETDAAG